MATQGNGIEFYLDVDTSQAVTSVGMVDKVNRQIEQSFKKVDTQVTKTAKGVSDGMKKAQQATQNFSYQIQDVAVQLAGGQSPFLVVAQQLPQMLTGMGAAAAGIGALVAVAGGLAMAFGDTATAADKMQSAIDRVGASITLGVGGVANYSEEMHRLKEVSEALTRIKLANLIADQQEAMKQAAIAVTEQIEGMRGSFDTFNDVIKDTFGTISMDGIAAYRALQTASKQFKTKPTEEGIIAIEAALEQATAAGINNTSQGRELVGMLTDLVFKFREGKITIDQLNGALTDNSVITEGAAKSAAKMVEAIKLKAGTLGMTDRQLALYTAGLNNATDAEIKLINSSFDSIEQFEAKEKATKEASDALKKYNDEMIRQAYAEDQAAIAADKAARKKLESGAAGLAGQYGDPLADLQLQKDKELEILRQAEEAGLQLHTEYQQLRSEIDAQYAEKERNAKLAMYAEESKINELLLGSVDALGVATTNTISGLLSGTYSATEAMQQFANTILNQAVGALVEVGIQYLQNALISQAADKAILTSQAATKTIAAGAHTAAVSATVTELTALGAMGAYAATAAIPMVGPALAPAASATAAGAIGAMGTAAIAAAPLAGTRYGGGDVTAGRLYEMGEKNKPEMMVIPGNNGRVFSNHEMNKIMSGGGGSSTQVIINNNAAGVQVVDRGVQSDGITEQRVLEIINEQSAQIGSKLSQNINKNHNTTNRLGGNRRN